MKMRLFQVLFFMMTTAVFCAIMILVIGGARNTRPVDREWEEYLGHFAQRLPEVWATSSGDEIFDVTTNAISAIRAIDDTTKRRHAISVYVDTLMFLKADDYKGRLNPLLLREKVLNKFLQDLLNTTERDVLLEFNSRVKFYTMLKRESNEFPELELPSLVDDIRASLPTNYHHVSVVDFTPEGMARHREKIDQTVRAVSKKRKRTYYGRYVREEMRSEEDRYYDNALKNRYQVISEKYRTNVLEKVRATIGRYPKWYSPQ